MIPIDNSQARMKIQDSHLNTQGLESLKTMGRERDPEALREVAKKFESLFVHQMLKNMRSANDVFSEGNFLNSSETKFHQEMLDQQLSLELTKGTGLGLAEVLYRQMQHAYGDYLSSATSAPDAFGSYQLTAKSVGGKTRVANSPEEFIAALKPYAEKAAAELNVNADVLLAQAALETGWGRKVIHTPEGHNSHNLFNIKADQSWQGNSVNVPTLEYHQGIARQERADFRRYDDYAQSFDDYVNFLQSNPRYREALQEGGDSANYAEELQRAGYATDPEYADKIKRLLNTEAVRAAIDENPIANDYSNEA